MTTDDPHRDGAARGDWVFGIHAVRPLIRETPHEIRRLVVPRGLRSRHIAALVVLAHAAGVRIDQVPAAALERRARQFGVGSPGGIAAERQPFAPATERDLEARWEHFHNPLLVVLDGIQDPRNLGACLRTAEAAGAAAVLLPRRGSAPLSSVVAKAASGALECLFVVEVANLARRMAWLGEQGVWLVGGVDSGDVPYTDVDYRGAVAVVVGGEGKGLRRLTRVRCDHLAHIPMHGATPNLNVSVALGVLLFEARRQRDAAGQG